MILADTDILIDVARCHQQSIKATFVDTYYLSHGMLIADALIAATAVTHGYRLLTRNRKHFEFLSGLELASPDLSAI
jgi:predicted nucleic acid-binding protein